MQKNSTIALIASIGIAQLAGIIGSIFTTPNISTWYASLTKPAWNPPNWLFGPVWLTLFVLMGIASYRIWLQRKKPEVVGVLVIYVTHLAVNIAWSMLFFGAKLLDVAFYEIIVLWLLIGYLIIRFHRIDKLAGYLLIPYFAWVSFATLLNYTVWMLNK